MTAFLIGTVLFGTFFGTLMLRAASVSVNWLFGKRQEFDAEIATPVVGTSSLAPTLSAKDSDDPNRLDRPWRSPTTVLGNPSKRRGDVVSEPFFFKAVAICMVTSVSSSFVLLILPRLLRTIMPRDPDTSAAISLLAAAISGLVVLTLLVKTLFPTSIGRALAVTACFSMLSVAFGVVLVAAILFATRLVEL